MASAAPSENSSLVCVGPVKRGRPSSWTEEIAADICARIANGETLTEICADEDMPGRSTVTEWLMKDLHGFSGQYAHARAIQAIHEDDECKQIADEAFGDYYIDYDKDGKPFVKVDSDNIQRAKLRIETRRWRAERLNRRVYGNSIQHKHEVEHPNAAGAEALPPGLDFLAKYLPEPQKEG